MPTPALQTSPCPAAVRVAAAALVLGAALAGCAQIPAPVETAPALAQAPACTAPPPEPVASCPEPAVVPSPQDVLLRYADAVRQLDGAALAAQRADLERAAQQDPGAADAPALRLALVLLPTRQPADTARALGLVQRTLEQPSLQELHPLARLLQARLLQQRRLEEQLQQQGQQLREVQRRNEQLDERLDAVRALERSLNARPARPRGSSRVPATR
ncbi:hypothetical protein [Oryzisolibacter propanilivorax]|nr:hypothetical protein [Oryzisolibacter propanilivorax]